MKPGQGEHKMIRDIERINYLRDDQIPQTSHFRAVHQRFRLKDAKCGIVEVDGPSLVILFKGACYLIFRSGNREFLQKIWDDLKQVSISMSLELPLKENETIMEGEEFAADFLNENLNEPIKDKNP